MKKINLFKIFVLFCFIGIFLGLQENIFSRSRIYFMPKEYKKIKRLVNKIASKNYLGDREIPFLLEVEVLWKLEQKN